MKICEGKKSSRKIVAENHFFCNTDTETILTKDSGLAQTTMH